MGTHNYPLGYARTQVLGSLSTTESIWLAANRFISQQGAASLATVAASGDVVSWLLDATTNEGLATTLLFPSAWATFHMDFWWANGGAGTGDARVRGLVNTVAVGSATETVVATGTGTVGTAGVQHSVIKTRVQTGVVVTAGALHVIMPRRNAADAADTLANDIAFLGMELVRAS